MSISNREGLHGPGEGAAKQQSRPQGGLSFGSCFANENSGAGEGIRTLDPDLGKVVLYH